MKTHLLTLMHAAFDALALVWFALLLAAFTVCEAVYSLFNPKGALRSIGEGDEL